MDCHSARIPRASRRERDTKIGLRHGRQPRWRPDEGEKVVVMKFAESHFGGTA